MATTNKKTIEQLNKYELIKWVEELERKHEALQDLVLKHLTDHEAHRGDNYGNRF